MSGRTTLSHDIECVQSVRPCVCEAATATRWEAEATCETTARTFQANAARMFFFAVFAADGKDGAVILELNVPTHNIIQPK